MAEERDHPEAEVKQSRQATSKKGPDSAVTIEQPVAASGPENPTNLSAKRSGAESLSKYWGAILLITAGLILLLNNLDILPWTMWLNLLQLWPIALILIGLDLLMRRSRFSQLIIFLVGLIVLVAAVAYSVLVVQPQLYDDMRRGLPWMPQMQLDDRRQSSTVELEVDGDQYNNVESREIEVDMGAGMLTVSDSSAGDYYARLVGTFAGSGGEPILDSRLTDGKLRIKIVDQEPKGFNFNFGESRRDYALTVGQSAIPTSTRIDVGAGKAKVDFSSLQLTSAVFGVGAGAVEVSLSRPSLPSDQMKLDVGAGSIVLRVPENVGLQLRHEVGLGSITVDGTKLEREGQFQTQGYAQAEATLAIEAHVGVGKIEIVRK